MRALNYEAGNHGKPILDSVGSDQPTSSAKSTNGIVPKVTNVQFPYLKNYIPVSVFGAKIFAMVDTGTDVNEIHPYMLHNHPFNTFTMVKPDMEFMSTALSQ